jgi:beta-galactosidase
MLELEYRFIDLSAFNKQLPAHSVCFNTGQTRTFYHDEEANEDWLPDKSYEKGNWGYKGGEVYRNWPGNKWWNGVREGVHKPVALTNDEPVFQTFIEGLSEWKADLPDGKYRITLYLCETLNSSQRKGEERIQTITVNGETWIKELNLEKQYGLLTAVTLDKEIHCINNKGLSLQFNSVSGKTIMNGIRIQKL